MNKQIKNIVFIAIMAAMMCVLAPISFPIGIIPISLGTFALCLIGAMLPWHKAFTAVGVYIIIGLVGLPVFSSYRGGIGVIIGATGGYILGYLPAVIIMSLLINRYKNKWFLYPIGMIIGVVVCYLFGSVWYMIQSENSFIQTLSVCVIPFLLPDLLKIIVASVITYILNTKTVVGKMLNTTK